MVGLAVTSPMTAGLLDLAWYTAVVVVLVCVVVAVVVVVVVVVVEL